MTAHNQILAATIEGADQVDAPVAVPERARQTAARLAALFETDQRLCERLTDAGRRLHGACEHLRHGPDVDLLSVADPRPGALALVTTAGVTIHQAFCAYQQICEQRRLLAVDVGELSQQLTDALTAAGFSQHDARRADVHALAHGSPPIRELRQ